METKRSANSRTAVGSEEPLEERTLDERGGDRSRDVMRNGCMWQRKVLGLF